MPGNNEYNHELRVRPAWRAFSLHFVAIAVFLFGPWLNPEAVLTPQTGQLVAVVLLLFILFKRYGSSYVLGIDALVVKNIGYQPVTIALRDINQVQLRQGGIKRLLNYGNLLVYSRENRPLVLYGLYWPEGIKHYIQKTATI